MSSCVKCGHNPDHDSCPHCGYAGRTTTVLDGELVYVCCRKPLAPKQPRGGKKNG